MIFPAVLTALTLLATSSPKLPLESIQRLELTVPEMEHKPFCTAWATKVEGLTKWVTAAHCVFRVEGEPEEAREDVSYTIGDKVAHVVKIDDNTGLALFSGPAATGLAVAFGEANVADKVHTISYFLADGIYVEGVVGGFKNDVLLLQLPMDSGGSGGPVLNSANMVVGVEQFVICRGACAISGGSTVKDIREFLNLDK